MKEVFGILTVAGTFIAGDIARPEAPDNYLF
jgi:hypothetical protein